MACRPARPEMGIRVSDEPNNPTAKGGGDGATPYDQAYFGCCNRTVRTRADIAQPAYCPFCGKGLTGQPASAPVATDDDRYTIPVKVNAMAQPRKPEQTVWNVQVGDENTRHCFVMEPEDVALQAVELGTCDYCERPHSKMMCDYTTDHKNWKPLAGDVDGACSNHAARTEVCEKAEWKDVR